MKYSGQVVLVVLFSLLAPSLQLLAQKTAGLTGAYSDTGREKLFYRGDYDGETVTAAKGAIVNKAYHTNMPGEADDFNKA